MIELCDWNKVESEEYKRINATIQKTIGEIARVTGTTLTPGDHYLFDYAFIISQIKQFKGVRFLDLGSASSPLSVYIAQQGGIVTAIDLPGRPDFASYFAKLKKELGIQITFLPLDFCSERLPKADIIISCSAIEHVGYERIPQLIRSARNALPPGGQFIFTVIAEPEPPERTISSYCSYREDKIRRTFLQGFHLEKDRSNFHEFNTLYQRFRKHFPKYFYIPVGVSLSREDD